MLLSAVTACFLSAPPLQAQTTSTIAGTVTDRQGLPVSGAQVRVVGTSVVIERSVTTGPSGEYRIAALPAGVYDMTVSGTGFRTEVYKALEVTLNRTLTFDVQLQVGAVSEKVEVSAELPLLETTSSSEGATILPSEIVNMPINGRNYLDLMQMVPGVVINRQEDKTSDRSVPVLGERAGNTSFLIDGLTNRDELNGGASAQFNQETISEFQVITTGYKAEFGHASGGVVNVITKSGANDTHGVASVFHRNNAFDSADIPDHDAPFLHRWDYSLALGGPVQRDKIFWFGSAERIDEVRELNFLIPPGLELVPSILASEQHFDQPSTDKESRFFVRLDENWGRHRFTEQMNYTNAHISNFLPLLQSTSLPSTRTNSGVRTLLVGLSDTALLGDNASPYILTLRGQYRRQPSSSGPSHPEAGPNTAFNVFSGYDTGQIFGDITTVSFGAVLTPGSIDQLYGTFGASLAKTWNRHTVKWGWDFVRTEVDGVENNVQFNQLFATIPDYDQFGPIDAGFFLLLTRGGETPAGNQIRLRNNYNGLFAQDDWKIRHNLTLNLGVRWDYDSEFKTKDNVSPRLGFAWGVTPKTVVRGSWGLFYDHFRLGIGRDVPGFGGADLREIQPLSYPRLFYGIPTIAPALFGLCLSPTETDAQLAARGATCPYPFDPPGTPIYGVDHLSGIVAPGHAPIPGNVVVNLGNVQDLTGLTPEQYLDQASQAVGQPAGFFLWGPFGALSQIVIQPGQFPVTIDPSFKTPYTQSLNFGVQRQVSSDWVVALDYYHKDIRDILGTRQTSLTFESRIDNSSTAQFVNGYGPWYSGTYDAGILSFQKRMSHRFAFGGSYAYVSEHDDAYCSGLDSTVTGICFPTDSFRGTATVVTDPVTGQTNADAAFVATNGNFVPKAGTFYDGAKLDSGPSDLSVRHTFELHGLVQLPWQVELSSLYRVQSGFPYTQTAIAPVDADGNSNFNGRDLKTARNQFRAPHFQNMDLRIAKTIKIGDRVKLQGLFEFFNLFNSANPAAVQLQEGGAAGQSFGAVSQFLPGREGQIGLRIEF